MLNSNLCKTARLAKNTIFSLPLKEIADSGCLHLKIEAAALFTRGVFLLKGHSLPLRSFCRGRLGVRKSEDLRLVSIMTGSALLVNFM